MQRQKRRLRATISLQPTRGTSSCRPLIAASSAQVAACALNGTDSLVAALADVLHGELAGRACRLARLDSGVWRPPARVSLLLLQKHAQATTEDGALRHVAVRQSRSASLNDLRASAQLLLDSTWPAAPPMVHSDMVLTGLDDMLTSAPTLHEMEAAALIEACASGGQRCGNGIPPSLGPEPPLRMLLFAHAPLEHPPLLLDRHGHALPTGAGFVLPPRGALLPWFCDDDSESCATKGHNGRATPTVRTSLVAQLRVLMGLADAPTTQLLATTLSVDSGLAVHWLEAEALQLACTSAHVEQAKSDLRVLDGFLMDVDAVRFHASAAHGHLLNTSILSGHGNYAQACAQAAQASTHAREAVRHPSLLVIAELPEQWWLTTWPPLFFPVFTAVAAEVRRVLLPRTLAPRCRPQ